ncbi:MAG TPA: ABC transporter substrate-binding protein [Acidimicrobiales bacterium]|nr:ABC transporter substrate-binding protein [Acidimicrobiales bacterium]
MRSQSRIEGRRHPTGVAAVLVVALIATACGARVSPFLGTNSVAQGGTNQGAATSGSGATTTTGAGVISGGTAGGTSGGSTGSAGSSGGSTGSGAVPLAGPATPTSSGFNFSAQAEAGACQGTTGNGSSDVGVSPTQLSFGNVSGLTGPLTGSFSQGTEGVEALFSAINAAGGICGRKLSLNAEDDQQNAATNASDVADLIPKVLAFVGSTSDGDNGGVPAMAQANVPDVGFAINCNRSESPVYWSPAAGSCNQPNGSNGPYFISNAVFNLAKQGGYFPTKMAFLAYSIAISAQAAQQFEYIYKAMGGTVCYSDFAVSPASASLESDVAAMQQAGCNGSFDTMDVTGNAKLLQAMQQQSYRPPYVAATFDAYTPVMISQAGQTAAQGLIVGLPFVPLSESQPMVQLYQQQLATYEPGKQPSGFGFLAWQAAQMLVYALLQSGRNPTRASIVKVFNSLQNWTGGGALGGYTPSSHGVYTCDVDVTIQGSSFVRKAPSSGLFCGGQAVQASS